MRKTCSIAVLVLLATSTGLAITRIVTTKRLYLKLATSHIAEAETAAGDPIDTGVNKFTVRTREATEIWLFDPNPLLFTYEAKTVLSDTADYKAALDFAKQLQVLLGRFPGASGGSGDVTDSVVEGLRLVAFREAILTLQSRFEDLPALIAESVDPARVPHMKQVAAGIPLIATTVEAGYARAFAIWTKCLANQMLTDQDGNPVSCDAPFDIRAIVRQRRERAALQDATMRLEQAQSESGTAKIAADAANTALTDAQKAVDAATAAQPPDPNRIRELTTTLTNARAATNVALARARAAEEQRLERAKTVGTLTAAVTAQETPVANAYADAARGQTIRAFIRDVLSAEMHIRTSITTLRSFAKDADAVMVPRKLETRPYSLQTQLVTVSVKPETKYQEFLTAETKKKQAAGIREIQLQLDAYRTAYLRPGVGFVLGFVRNPTFSTAKDGDDFKIVRADSSLTRYTVAAMLDIVPVRWSEPTFGGFFQLGISPKSDETGFFFGGGIAAQSMLTFGGGLMLQQTRQLSNGLTLTSKLAKPEDLKTETVFKPGLYLHATVTLPK